MQGTNTETNLRHRFVHALRWLRLLTVCAVIGALAEFAIAEMPPSSSAVPLRYSASSPAKVGNHRFSKGLERQPVVTISKNWEATFGLRTTFATVDGVGSERIHHVELGSLAKSMKLMPGDAIVAVNGIPLSNPHSWDQAIQRAARLGGWLTLKVRDGRTGVIAYRTGNLQSVRGR